MGDVDYQKLREENIRKNNELLMSLGLNQETAFLPQPPKDTSAKKQRRADKKKKEALGNASNKRTIEEASEGDEGDEPAGEDESENTRPTKSARIEADENDEADEAVSRPARRSARNSGKPRTDYSNDGGNSAPKHKQPPKTVIQYSQWEEEDEDKPRNRLGKRKHDPKTFGHIPGIPVGKWWELRMHCSTDAVHAPTVSGISGNPKVGAWSIALSGGYEDDVDLGEAFTFTGSGGRDLKGTKQQPKNLRTAPQSKDQSFDTPTNGALLKSCETKKPIRVIRGFKGAVHSKYAPAAGYRYDGLYVVEKAWMERGLNKGGFKVCKFALKRVSGQPPIPVRSEEESEGEGSDEEGSEEPESEDEVE